MDKLVTLICAPLEFYTQNDEDLLFDWFGKVNCIKNVKGIGRGLHIQIVANEVTDDALLDLMGIFDRYKFDAEQLRVFMTDDNKEWFDQ